MTRKKKVIITSHCIINQNSVVRPLARARGGFKNIILTLIENDIGIVQMPCPEFIHLGLNRTPMSKEEYNTKEYIELCDKIASDTVIKIKEYLNNDYEVVGLLGINQSPTCSINGVKGHLMESLLEKLRVDNIMLPLIDLPTTHQEGSKQFIKELEAFIAS